MTMNMELCIISLQQQKKQGLSPSAGIQVGCCLSVCVQEGESGALLCTQLDAVGRSLTSQEVPDQLDLTVL